MSAPIKHLLSRYTVKCPFCHKILTFEKYHLYHGGKPLSYVHKEWLDFCEHMQDPNDNYTLIRFASSVMVPLVEVV